ncbi:MAG: hypothetical protein IJ251_03735 [Oscillospiraceae bacterium]|nr:hypothetical protein [Oscillospiraceae bacterium]
MKHSQNVRSLIKVITAIGYLINVITLFIGASQIAASDYFDSYASIIATLGKFTCLISIGSCLILFLIYNVIMVFLDMADDVAQIRDRLCIDNTYETCGNSNKQDEDDNDNESMDESQSPQYSMSVSDFQPWECPICKHQNPANTSKCENCDFEV